MSESVLKFWNRLVCDGPDEAALFTPNGDAINRKEIDERSERLVRQWELDGLKARRVIVLNVLNGADWICSFLACLRIGAVAVPLDPGLREPELLEIAKDLGIQAVWDGKRLKQNFVDRPYRFRKKDISIGKLTSGTTGKPKKLFFTETEMIADTRNLIRCMGIRPNDTNLGLIPWGHSYGLGNIVYPLLMQGTRATWTDTPFPSDIGEVCRRVQCTVFPSVPTVIKALVRSGCEKSAFESLRLAVSAGSRLDPSLARGFYERFGKRVHNFYGSTETGGICFDESGDAALTGRSVGKPIKGVSIIQGRGKRFYVESAAVYGYGNRKRSKALMADYGRLDESGELVLESRANNLMKIGARRISPADIESRLLAIDDVNDVVVFALEREDDAVIAAAIESSLERGPLGAMIRETLPLRLRPKKFVTFDCLPRSARGKADLPAIKRSFA